MQAYFRMNNEILDLGLSPNELKVAVCLYSCVFRNHYSVQIKQSTIADKCGIKKVETVSKIIYKLQKLGVIERIERPLKSNGWFGTSVYKLKSVAVRGYFKVYRNVLGKLSGVQLRMYLFVCRAVTKKNDMWNSFNDISRALQISRNKIISVINELVELGVIRKLKIVKKDGSYSDNHYSINNPEEKQETVQNPDPKEENLQQDIMPSKTLIKPLYPYDENLKSVCSSKYPKFFYFYSGVVP